MRVLFSVLGALCRRHYGRTRVGKTLVHAQENDSPSTSRPTADAYISAMRPLQVAFEKNLPFHHYAKDAAKENAKPKERVKRLTKEIGSLMVWSC